MLSFKEHKTTNYKYVWARPGAAREYDADAVTSRNGIVQIKNRVEQSIVLRNSEGLVLDAGTGTGKFAIPLARNYSNSVVTLDYSMDMLEFNQDVSAKEGLDVRYVRGDVGYLPFPSDTFNTVVSMAVLKHFPQYRSILTEYARVLKPNGKLIFDMTSGDHIACANRIVRNSETRFIRMHEAAVPFSELKGFLETIGIEVVDRFTYDFFNNNYFHMILSVNRWGYKALQRLMSIIFAIRFLCCLVSWSELSFLRYLPPVFSYHYMIVGRKR